MIQLTVLRKPSDEHCTEGELLFNGEHQAFTLEPVVRDVKIQNETAIPAGTYNVTLTFSPHFNRTLPLINDVPNFEGVRIHPGNTAADTEGCLLVGMNAGNDSIANSRVAFDALYAKLEAAQEPIQITYING
jgi:hypothetical protein